MRLVKYILTLIFLIVAPCAFAQGYKRIISLAPSVTESLYALGLGDKIVALTIYCPNPNNLGNIGTTLGPNIEQIVYLKPDLVIACEEANQIKTVEKLEGLGINVFFVQESKTFADICRNFILLGKEVGKEELAGQIVEKAGEDMELLAQRTEKHSPQKVFWEVGARPIITVNRESFVDEIIKFSGGVNIFSNLKSKYPRISSEEVVMRNPDVIILTTMGDVTDDELRRWKKYQHINAVKNNRIYILDSSLVCWPIPSKFVKAVEYLSGLFWSDE